MSSSRASVDNTVLALVEALEDAAVPDKAPAMTAYMRDQFPFLGVDSPTRRAVVRPAFAASKGMSGADVLEVADRLWNLEHREYQYVAADLLRRHAHTLEPDDLDQVRGLITTKSWWDTVDTLAAHVVGPIVHGHPESRDRMDAWVTAEDLWVARAAILHQLGWKADTDADRLFSYCEQQAGHRDFFIRKAIGWALRDYARTDPDAVRTFVVAHVDTLSPLSVQEACKHIGVPT